MQPPEKQEHWGALARCSCCQRNHLFTRKASMTCLEMWILTGDRPAAPPHRPTPPLLKAPLHSPTPHTQGRCLQLPGDIWH